MLIGLVPATGHRRVQTPKVDRIVEREILFNKIVYITGISLQANDDPVMYMIVVYHCSCREIIIGKLPK